jgi:hypothetical protein
LIIEHKCYYINVESEDEADFLSTVFSAQCLQRAFVDSKVSPFDFGTYPLRSIPVPKYDPTCELHIELASLGNRAEAVANTVPATRSIQSMRPAILQALEDDGVSEDIDRLVRELLPDYATL